MKTKLNGKKTLCRALKLAQAEAVLQGGWDGRCQLPGTGARRASRRKNVHVEVKDAPVCSGIVAEGWRLLTQERALPKAVACKKKCGKLRVSLPHRDWRLFI